jgi:hypothetical protein
LHLYSSARKEYVPMETFFTGILKLCKLDVVPSASHISLQNQIERNVLQV